MLCFRIDEFKVAHSLGNVLIETMTYPAAAHQFLVCRTDHGLTLLTARPSDNADVSYVTNLPPMSDDALARFLNALHETAWSNDRHNWDALAQHLPAHIVQACEDALHRMPASNMILLDDDGEPVDVVQEILAHEPGSEELWTMLAAGYDLGLPVLAENYYDASEAAPAVRLRVLSNGPSIWPNELDKFWPSPGDATLTERKVIPPGQFKKYVTDPRWHSTYTRTCWAPMIISADEDDHSGCSTSGLWVVEFFAHAISSYDEE